MQNVENPRDCGHRCTQETQERHYNHWLVTAEKKRRLNGALWSELTAAEAVSVVTMFANVSTLLSENALLVC